MRRSTHTTITTLTWLLLVIGCLSYWVLQGRPNTYPDAPSGKFACLSYTPRSDETNSDSRRESMASRAQIDRDLLQLSKRTNCVRTYSVLNGLDYVPEAARKLGMQVLLGIWIGVNQQTNERELSHGIEIANANRDIINAIIVGNEVLLRREQTAAQLAPMLERVRAATHLPVTYADVWDFWLKNPSLAKSADFVTIHILPYWEDEPVGVDHAMEHVETIFNKVQRTFPDKRIYVGETGWPSVGRQRAGLLLDIVQLPDPFEDLVCITRRTIPGVKELTPRMSPAGNFDDRIIRPEINLVVARVGVCVKVTCESP